MNFPQFISFTLTNVCNQRCRMCGQWSENGYIANKTKNFGPNMTSNDWKRLVDEIAGHKIRFILIRGGEPFLFPGIIELLDYINSKGLFMSIDTNGTTLEKYAEDLVRLGNMHITFSVDGPEEIHDEVRGLQGSFQKTKQNIELLGRLDTGQKISKSICFTISKYSYHGLGQMPEVARSLGIKSINIVPYYYFSPDTGKRYEHELQQLSGCTAYAWKGFEQDDSGIDFDIFRKQLAAYYADLGDIENFPFLPLTEIEYRYWFNDSYTPVGSPLCMNVENLIDIQSSGEANFCIDFPDYCIGNVTKSTIVEIWNSAEANRFREYRRQRPLAVCYRCGAKYISEIKG